MKILLLAATNRLQKQIDDFYEENQAENINIIDLNEFCMKKTLNDKINFISDFHHVIIFDNPENPLLVHGDFVFKFENKFELVYLMSAGEGDEKIIKKTIDNFESIYRYKYKLDYKIVYDLSLKEYLFDKLNKIPAGDKECKSY